MDNSEIIELDFNDNWEETKISSNFGGGLELLMNDNKIKEKYPNNSKSNLEDLNDLENDLNNLVNETPSYKARSDLFKSSESLNLNYDSDNDVNLGKSTAQTDNNYNSKTWDGYGKFNNIPINPDNSASFEPKQNKEDALKEKFKYLKKLNELERKGFELSKKYTMDSSLTEMQGEYDSIIEDLAKKNSVKFQSTVFMNIIHAIEYLNGKFNPFDIHLDGLTDQITDNADSYDEIFAELHEKYKNTASMAPELKLLFQLGGSAMMVHITNTMFKTSLPNADEIFRQNPDLMRAFQTATLNTMAQTNPGFTGFMNNIGVTGKGMGPPPPMATQRQTQQDFSMPDYSGIKSNFIDTRPNFQANGSLRQDPNYSSQWQPSARQTRPNMNPERRPDMKGPSDINDILSGLKTRNINIQQSNLTKETDNVSTISMNDIKDLDTQANLPKKSRRRKTSSTTNNTVSLDI